MNKCNYYVLVDRNIIRARKKETHKNSNNSNNSQIQTKEGEKKIKNYKMTRETGHKDRL